MNKETRKWHVYFRLYILIAMAVAAFYLAIRFFEAPWATGPVLFNLGVDVMGLFICITLYYGCIDDEKISLEESTYWLIALIFQIALGFFNNELTWLVTGRSEYRNWCLFFNELSLIFDFSLVMLFYNYVRRTLIFLQSAVKAWQLFLFRKDQNPLSV